jgi:hypothetical protein
MRLPFVFNTSPLQDDDLVPSAACSRFNEFGRDRYLKLSQGYLVDCNRFII